MAENYKIYHSRESGLSEVIGFVLLLGIIVAAFSIYLTYGVPAQGRENEISHMDVIKDEFTTYKTGIDSLWTNNMINTVMSSTFQMGTAGVTTQGSNGFLPILQPVASGGTVKINNLSHTQEYLNIISYSYITNLSFMMNDTPLSFTNSFQSQFYPNPPQSLIVNLSVTKNIKVTNCSVNLSGTDNNGVNWQVLINVTPRQTFYQTYIAVLVNQATCLPAQFQNGTPIWLNNGGTTNRACLVPMNQYNYTGTDFTLNVFKNNTESLSNLIVTNNIVQNQYYNINLLDPAYGLSSNIQNTPTITRFESDSAGDLTTTLTAQYAYNLWPNYQYNVSLGALEYSANNYYWIPQTYYYQMGGVFLSQMDGVSAKIPPSITFSYNRTDSLINVNVIDVAYDQSSTGTISGSTPVQIGTKIKADSGVIPYAPITKNTINVTINYTSSSPSTNTNLMWQQFFKDAANRTGGVPDNLYVTGTTANGAYIVVNGFTVANTPDINLKVNTVNLTASILSISGV